MIAFDSMEKAQAWYYHSAEYQKSMPIRQSSRTFIVEGMPK